MKNLVILLCCIIIIMSLTVISSAKFRNEGFDYEPIQELRLTIEYVPMPVDYPVLSQIDIKEDDVTLIAKTLWGECRGCSELQQQAVVWCILNRVDDDRFPATVAEVVKQPYQFLGYSDKNPVDAELYAVALDTMARWQMEPYVKGGTGRVIPKDFCWFGGDGKVNTFRNDSGEKWCEE